MYIRISILQATVLLLTNLFFAKGAMAQFSIGTWRDHLPYGRCIDVCAVGEEVYCATPYSIFIHTPATGENFRISKVNYLSDSGITAIEYDSQSGYVVVGYDNGNVDLITASAGINIPDIKFSSIIGDKAIYDIYPFGNRVYLCTGFGIVVLDMVKLEVKESYFIGPNGGPIAVNDMAIVNDTIYALTEGGMLAADANNTFLANFQNWHAYTNLPVQDTIPKHIEIYHDSLLLCIPEADQDIVWAMDINTLSWDTIFNDNTGYRIREMWSNNEWFTISAGYSFLAYQDGYGFVYNFLEHEGEGIDINNVVHTSVSTVWCADNSRGLLRRSFGNIQTTIRPPGPSTADCRRIGAYNNNVWIAHGGADASWTNRSSQTGISGFVNDGWRIIPAGRDNWPLLNQTEPYEGLRDVMDIAVDPIDNDRIYFGSWDEGLMWARASTLTGDVANTDGTDSIATGEPQQGFWPGWRGVAGVAFDINGVVWCTNSYTPKAIHALDRTGNLHSFDFDAVLEDNDKVGDIISTANGYVWAWIAGKGLLVLNHNGTLANATDDSYKLLTDGEGEGGLPSRDVLCMEEDLDGEVWVGTAQGLGVYYNTEAIFTDQGFDAEQILIVQDGNVQELLATETITCIEIDGSNRKWVGTQNSGVYLFSDDGLQQIYHFTAENSPIFSNTIYDIAINHDNGEVFIGTEKGVIGFFSTATNYDPEMTNVRVFPNPVRPEYAGNITIDGLAYNTSVKVTDMQGNIVYETESEGGRAVWDGKTFAGDSLTSGVYLVFVTTPDGSADEVKQLTIIR
ncbi:MAG: T9SS type A sorting domain-containing protein [Flavobacteriales bacterium]